MIDKIKIKVVRGFYNDSNYRTNILTDCMVHNIV